MVVFSSGIKRVTSTLVTGAIFAPGSNARPINLWSFGPKSVYEKSPKLKRSRTRDAWIHLLTIVNGRRLIISNSWTWPDTFSWTSLRKINESLISPPCEPSSTADRISCFISGLICSSKRANSRWLGKWTSIRAEVFHTAHITKAYPKIDKPVRRSSGIRAWVAKSISAMVVKVRIKVTNPVQIPRRRIKFLRRTRKSSNFLRMTGSVFTFMRLILDG